MSVSTSVDSAKGGRGGSQRDEALRLLMTIGRHPNPSRGAMARVAALRAVVEAQVKPVGIPGWSPPAEPQGAPAPAEDDGTWAGGGEPEAKH